MSDRKALVKSIVTHLGRQRIADEVGATPSAVSNATASGKFPAHWYAIMLRVCAAEGIECPLDAFAMHRQKPKTKAEQAEDAA